MLDVMVYLKVIISAQSIRSSGRLRCHNHLSGFGYFVSVFISGSQKFINHQCPVVIRARADQKVILTEYFCY